MTFPVSGKKIARKLHQVCFMVFVVAVFIVIQSLNPQTGQGMVEEPKNCTTTANKWQPEIFIGHSYTIYGVWHELKMEVLSIYTRPRKA